MSQNQSACIPPPSDYAPRGRPPQSSTRRGRGAKGCRDQGRGRYSRQSSSSTQRDHYVDLNTTTSQPKDRFYRNEDDDYFGRIQDEDEPEDPSQNIEESEAADEEDDPLDAYMKSLEAVDSSEQTKAETNSQDNNDNSQPEKSEASINSAGQELVEKRGVRLDIEDNDDIEESYYKYVEETKTKRSRDSAEHTADSEERQNMVDYDQDGNIVGVRKLKKEIDPLPSIDHSTMNYENFEKVFYNEHSEIERLTVKQGDELRAKLEIKVSGSSPPKPVCSFAHFKFDEQLMRVIRKSEYTQPTPIQAQAIPAALLGRNIIGIAMTGSGKTAAYLWPMIVHIMGQPDLKRGDGPIALVLVPTRELALQVYGEAKKFSSSYKIAAVCAYGGGSKYEQSRDLESGAEIVVATPGRMIDLIKMGVTNLKRVTYLVLDEADRFFEMGFEAQVRSICDHIRPDRQTLLFSATFRKKIEQLARTVTDDPVKIVQKGLGEANEDVSQHVIILPDASKKWDWLTSKLVEFTSAGSVLIFVTRIMNSEELHKNLKEYGKETLLLHGDMEQSERNRVITLFKRKEMDIMIATDVAARGLDIAHIRTVINYDVARDTDTHVHRVGRTGRAGTKGDAYTLMTDKDKDFAGHLVKTLESSQQKINDDLMKLAMQSHSFRKSRYSKGHPRPNHESDSHHRNHEHHRSGGSGHKRYHNDRNHHSHHHDDRHRHRDGERDRDSHFRSQSSSYDRGTNFSSRDDQRKRNRWH